MKKGKVRIIIGFILVFLQLLSVLGNAKSGAKISLSFDNPNIFLYDLIGLFSYFLVGIIGVVLLVSGLIAYNRRPKEIRDIKKPDDKFLELFTEAFADATKNSREKAPILLKGQRPNEADYGYSESNPICSSTLAITDIYLANLRTADGKKFTRNRTKNIRADINGVSDVGIDIYQLYLDNEPYKTLYIVPYVSEPIYAPYGLVLLNDSHEQEETDHNSPNILDTNIKPGILHSNKKSMNRYCSRCGNKIDVNTKKCSGCGKQNFHISFRLLTLIAIALICCVGCFFAYNCFQFTVALENKEFADAKRHLAVIPLGEKMFVEQKEYLDAGLLMEEGEYIEAYRILKKVKGYNVPQNIIDELKIKLYSLGQTAYRAGEIDSAEDYFSSVSDYKQSDDYLMLIKCSKDTYSSWLTANSYYKELLIMVNNGFENADEIILMHSNTMEQFLKGRWESNIYYFEHYDDEEGEHSRYNLPHKNIDGYYSLSDGLFRVEETDKTLTKVFRFSIIDEDTISVYCFKDGNTHTLYRQ